MVDDPLEMIQGAGASNANTNDPLTCNANLLHEMLNHCHDHLDNSVGSFSLPRQLLVPRHRPTQQINNHRRRLVTLNLHADSIPGIGPDHELDTMFATAGRAFPIFSYHALTE